MQLTKAAGYPHKLPTGNATITTDYLYPPTIFLFIDGPSPVSASTIDIGVISIISILVFERRIA
jgi:hypothetical protein